MKRMPFHTTALLRRFAAGFFLVAGMLSCSAPQATFTNPLRDGADPWITKYDGRYYTCFKSGRGIAVTESDDMTRFERERVVWQPADSGAWNSFNIWAPELHRLRGKWYIYYAAAPVPGSPFTGQRTGVLECDTPLGDYRDRGMLYTGDNPDGKTDNIWAIDMTIFEHRGELYAVWSGWERQRDTDATDQLLYIARMESPTRIGPRILLSRPDQPWEQGDHIALQEGEEVPLTDALYATQMASANDGANLLAEYFGGGTIADGVAAMNAQVEELGLAHTHFSNPHGISDDDHYTSCYDMAQILRWALQQPGFEELFTRNKMYTMQPTNIQPVTRYFSQQDKIRIGSSRYHIDSVLGSKLGYTNTARYSYVCLAEQDGVRLICATMQSQLSTDKYNDMRTLLDYAFSTYKSYTQLPGGTVTAQLAVAGGGQSLGTVTVADPGVKLLLAEGLSAQDVTVDLELPEQYLLGAEPAVYAVYTLNGGAQQESTSVRVKAEITGLAELLEQSVGTKLEAARDVEPGSSAWLLAGISVGCTVGAAVVTVLVLRVHSRLKKRRKTARHHKKA